MGTLFLVSTPIGNLDDISIRALKVLFSSSVIACEDTRRTGQLLSLLKERFPEYVGTVLPKLIAYHDKNEEKVVPELVSLLEGGTAITLVSDAGTPLISDPGYRLVQIAIKRTIPIISVPGASAVLPALQLSGFPVNQWTFIGYLPEKQGHRIKLLQSLKLRGETVVSYCAPHKLCTTLSDVASVYSLSKQIAVIRELTKIHEDVWRGTVKEAKEAFQDVKGELVLVF